MQYTGPVLSHLSVCLSDAILITVVLEKILKLDSIGLLAILF